MWIGNYVKWHQTALAGEPDASLLLFTDTEKKKETFECLKEIESANDPWKIATHKVWLQK